jgi:hypothetical protein
VLGFQRNVPVPGTIMFEQNVVANGIDEGSETGSFSHSPIGSNRANHTGEGLLPQIVDGVRGEETSTQL